MNLKIVIRLICHFICNGWKHQWFYLNEEHDGFEEYIICHECGDRIRK